MAKKRYINTQFWRDSYIANLDPSEKLVFLYLITNPDTNISGIYQIPLKIIATDTGFDKEMVIKILARFEKDNKVKYENGWVALKNFQKNQNEKSPNVAIGIKNEMLNAPETLQNWIKSKEIDCHTTVSHLNLDLDSDIDSNIDYNEYSDVDDLIIEQEQFKLYQSENFEKFWTLYDKKVERSMCERKWKKIKPDIYEFIFDHVERYVKSTPDKQYRKNPETYLNNCCWNDEIVTGASFKPSVNDTLKHFEEMEKTL